MRGGRCLVWAWWSRRNGRKRLAERAELTATATDELRVEESERECGGIELQSRGSGSGSGVFE